MRLPAITPRQIATESARALHERIWTAHLSGQAYALPVDPHTAGQDLIAFSSNLHRFWAERGFRLRLKQSPDRAWILMRVEPRRETGAAA